MNSNPDQEENNYWQKIDREAPIVAIAQCEDAAKQLITLVSMVSAIYVGLISFSDVLKQPLLLRPTLLFVLLPMPFWLVGLILAIKVIVPRTYNVRKIREDYEGIKRSKYAYLKWSYAFLVLGIVALLAVLIIYLLFVPPPPVQSGGSSI